MCRCVGVCVYLLVSPPLLFLIVFLIYNPLPARPLLLSILFVAIFSSFANKMLLKIDEMLKYICYTYPLFMIHTHCWHAKKGVFYISSEAFRFRRCAAHFLIRLARQFCCCCHCFVAGLSSFFMHSSIVALIYLGLV